MNQTPILLRTAQELAELVVEKSNVYSITEENIVAKVYFIDPVKVNCWNERSHIAWLDKIAEEQGGTRQGILRQVLDGVMNFTGKTPGALASILGYASPADTPLRARKPKSNKLIDIIAPAEPPPEAPPKRKRGRPRKAAAE